MVSLAGRHHLKDSIKPAATLDFDIALNTHSVDLGYDLTQIATLSSDTGEQKPSRQNGMVPQAVGTIVRARCLFHS